MPYDTMFNSSRKYPVSNENQDYHDLIKSRQATEHSLANWQAIIHLMKGLVGTGILSLAAGYYDAGLWTGLALTVLIIGIDIHCMNMLVRSSHHYCLVNQRNSLDYADLAEACALTGPTFIARLSGAFRVLVNACLIITQLGFCCAYLAFTAQNIEQVVDYYACKHHDAAPLSIHVYLVIILVPVVLLALVRHLKYIAPISALSNVLYGVGLIITLQYICRDLPHTSTLPAWNSIASLPLFFGTVMFSFEGVSLILPIENRMRDPLAMPGWTGVLNCTCWAVAALYCAIGFYGYLKFGADVKTAGTITLNLPKEQILYQAVKIMLAVGVFCTYAVQFYVPIEILTVWLNSKYPGQDRKILILEYVGRVGMVVLTFGLAEAIPHVDLFISLVGSFTGAALALIFPPIIDLLNRYPSGEYGRFRWVMVKNGLIILLGILGFLTGTYSSILAIVNKFQEKATTTKAC